MNTSLIYNEIAKIKNLSIQQLEKELGFSNGAIGKAIKRNSQIKPDTLEKILDKFPELNKNWLLTGEGEILTGEDFIPAYLEHRRDQKLNYERNTIPFYGWPLAVAGKNHSADMAAITEPTGRIDIGDVLRDSEAALQVFNNSMIPNYPPGCIIGLTAKNNLIIEPGRVYVIETSDDRIIKRLYYSKESKEAFMCVSDNDLKRDAGPMAGEYYYPPFDIPFSEIKRLYAVTGVIKRNKNSMIVHKD